MIHTAKKGDWVRIHSILLKAEERTAKLPEDTRKCDLQLWTKGFLQEEFAEIGDKVTVLTSANRLEQGSMIEINPYYTHSYGKCIPEIVQIEKELKDIMYGGSNNGTKKGL